MAAVSSLLRSCAVRALAFAVRLVAGLVVGVVLVVVFAVALGWAIGRSLAQSLVDLGAEALLDVFASVL